MRLPRRPGVLSLLNIPDHGVPVSLNPGSRSVRESRLLYCVVLAAYLVGRYGGEESSLLSPGAGLKSLDDIHIPTVRNGVTSTEFDAVDLTRDDCRGRRSKSVGRNRAVRASHLARLGEIARIGRSPHCDLSHNMV